MPTIADFLKEEDQKAKQGTIGDLLGLPSSPPALPSAELREQPSPLQEMFQPEGMFSAENVGAMGGGALGALYGAGQGAAAGSVLGIPGAVMGGLVGGLGGAGAGAGIGRASELLMQYLHGPAALGPVAGTVPLEQLPRPTLREALSQAGEAANRGIMSQAAGDIGGALLSKAAAPFASRMTPKRIAQLEAARQFGIRESAGQITENPMLQQMEGLIPRSPLSIGSSEQFIKGQQGDIQNALQNTLSSFAPDHALDLQEVGMKIAPIVENQASMPTRFLKQQEQFARDQFTSFIDSVAPGAVTAMDEAGKLRFDTIRANYKKAREAGSAVYDAVFAITKGKAYPLDDFRQALQQVRGEEIGTGAFSSGLIQKGQSVLDANTQGLVARPLAGTGQVDQAVQLLQANYGIPEEVARTFIYEGTDKQLHALLPDQNAPISAMNKVRSKLMAIAMKSERQGGFGVDPTGRAALILANGLQRSMEAIPEWQTMGPLKEAADKWWGAEVAGVFKNPQVMRQITNFAREGKYDQIIPLLYGPAKSVGPLRTFKKAVGQSSFDAATEAWGQGILRESIDPATGAVDMNAIARHFSARNYEPEYLQEIFGKDGYVNLVKILRTLQDAKTLGGQMETPEVIHALAKQAQTGDYEKIVPTIMGPHKSLAPMQTVQNLIGPDLSGQAAASQLHNVLINRAGNAQVGENSLQRALTAIGPQQYTPEALQQMLGPENATQLQSLRSVLQTVQSGRLAGENASNSGRLLIGAGQMLGMMRIAYNVAAHGSVSDQDKVEIGMLLTPQLIGRMIFSPTGVRLLSEGLRPQKTQTLVHLGTQLGYLLASPSAAETERLKREALAAH